MGLDSESPFARHVSSFVCEMSPSVVFDSFGADSPGTARFSPLPGLAHTVGILTLGEGAGRALAAESEAGASRGRLAEALLNLAREEGVRFVAELVSDEAEAERCDLSPIHFVTDDALLAEAVDRLQASKIGVSLEAGRLRPECSWAFCLSWVARPKGRRAKK
jgi:hypothetical protein